MTYLIKLWHGDNEVFFNYDPETVNEKPIPFYLSMIKSHPKQAIRSIFAAAMIFLLLFILMLSGCAHNQLQGVCRHEALYCSAIYIEKYPVRIAVGPPGHAQAQAFIDSQWRWISRDMQYCHVTEKDNFRPDQYLSVKEYLRLIEGSYPWKELVVKP